jgi:microcystin-dependent protein
MADTNTPILNLLLQETGGNNNAWGVNLNNEVITPLENAVKGFLTISGLTGGAYTLTQTNAVYQTILLSGTLSSTLTITVPSTANKWTIINNLNQGGAVGNPAFHVLIKTSGGTASAIPDRRAGLVITTDGTNIYRSDANHVGEVFFHAGFVGGGSCECDGTTRSRTGMPDLFNAIGTSYGAGDGVTTFALPDGKTLGKFLRSRTASVALGTVQTNQNLAHTHTITGVPAVGTLAVASSGSHTHTATVTDPGHVHAGVPQPSGAGGGGGFNTVAGTMNTSSATTGITVSNAADGAHTHSLTGALTAGTLATASSGGAGEARPENISMIMCIRY